MDDTPAPRQPPRFVPVLTEVVQDDAPTEAPAPPAAAAEPPARPVAATVSPEAEALQDQILHSVMQRVDVLLERDLHDAVASMVLQHTHALVPRLREEIEFVVRQAVSEAVAAELARRGHG